MTATSSNGINWTIGAEDTLAYSPYSAMSRVAWSPDLRIFMATGNNAEYRVYTSEDGVVWDAIETPDDAYRNIAWSETQEAFVILGSQFIALYRGEDEWERLPNPGIGSISSGAGIVEAKELNRYILVGSTAILLHATGLFAIPEYTDETLNHYVCVK